MQPLVGGVQFRMHWLWVPGHAYPPQHDAPVWTQMSLGEPWGLLTQVPVEQSPQPPQLGVAQQYPFAEQYG
jgi:hypothetical protein